MSSETESTPNIAEIVAGLRKTFKSMKTMPYEWRLSQLLQMKALVSDNEEKIITALHKDLRKPKLEAWGAEFKAVLKSIEFAISNLSSWMKPQKVSTELINQPGSSEIRSQPYGVVLIFGPWNYPALLTLDPLVGAISAGNCALVKPSEVSPATSALLAELIPKYLDTEAIQVIEGGPEIATEILTHKFDYIFYTGNGTVGRIIAQAAAIHLTPITLELGGKSPTIIDKNVNLQAAVNRIVWGKFANCGQTCVAPDYVLCHKDVHDSFIQMLQNTIKEFYGEDPKASESLGRIVNQRHARRLAGLIEDARQHEGVIVHGGQIDIDSHYISPTILENATPTLSAMQDEIFGPILPILKVESVEVAIEFVNERPRPLALYVFSSDSSVQQKVLGQTISGGACVNDCIMHLTSPHLPFGGVGESGMGSYHGKFSFDTFSHKKAVMSKSTWVDPSMRYPPYDENKLWWMKKLF